MIASIFARPSVTALSAFACSLVAPVFAVSGNDTVVPIGYSARSSTQPGGPAFSFVDISGSGTRLTFRDADDNTILDADDGISDPFDLDVLNDGHGFPYFGRMRKSVSMSTNGFLHFSPDGSSDDATNQCPLTPATAPHDAIFVLWDDLVLGNAPATSGGYVQFFSQCPYSQGGSGGCAVFQWDNADHFGGGTDSFDFQAVLYASGNILMLHGPGNPEHGLGSTTGIDDAKTEDRLTFACDTSNSIPDNSAILFDYPEPRIQLDQSVTVCTAGDLRGEAGCAEECGSANQLLIAPGAQVQFCYRVTNTGTLTITAHSLVDRVFGTLDWFEHALEPGDSLLITRVATIHEDTVNTATWSGEATFHITAATGVVRVLIDTDGDGIADVDDRCPGSDDHLDADADGLPDACDGCPLDANKSAAGACGCGVADTDSDGDHTPDCLDLCPFDVAKTEPGDCDCGTPDIDRDLDGTPDCLDGCPTDPLKIAPGTCGCGAVDVDSDGDGTFDCLDACPNDSGKVAPGTCGCGVADSDDDEDGIVNCLDNLPDLFNPEQLDFDGDGVGDDPNSLIGLLQACGLCGTGVLPVLMAGFPFLLATKRTLRKKREYPSSQHRRSD